MLNKKVIIIGATSGIGRALALCLANQGCELGITGRRRELLESLQTELATESRLAQFDLVDTDQSVQAFNQLVKDMGGVDIVIINSGVGSINPDFPLDEELDTVAVNVAGFTTIANLAFHHFSSNQGGQLVGISSVAAVRGGPVASYNASKAYVSSYLEGLACRAYAQKKEIVVTDIRPGFVNTAMAQGDGLFWVASPERAASQIVDAIKKKKRVVYVTKRWRLVATLISLLPFALYRRFSS